MTLARTSSTASTAAGAVATVPAPAPTPPAGGPPDGPGAQPPSALKQFLGLSDRWSIEFEANLLAQNDKFHMVARGTERFGTVRSRTLQQLVKEAGKADPSRVAVAAGGRTMTYDELDRRTDAVAAAVRAAGAAPQELGRRSPMQLRARARAKRNPPDVLVTCACCPASWTPN